jgi:hypothetical protein
MKNTKQEDQKNLEQRSSGSCPHTIIGPGYHQYNERNCPYRIIGPGSKDQHIDCDHCPEKRVYGPLARMDNSESNLNEAAEWLQKMLNDHT